MMKKLFLMICLASVALTGCKSKQATDIVVSGNASDGSVKSNLSLTGRKWQLTELAGKEVGNQQIAFILLEGSGNAVSGNLGCNNFAGSYELPVGNRIRFTGLAVTQKMCLNMETEDELKKALEMTDSYYISGAKLILNRARMVPLAVFTSTE